MHNPGTRGRGAGMMKKEEREGGKGRKEEEKGSGMGKWEKKEMEDGGEDGQEMTEVS